MLANFCRQHRSVLGLSLCALGLCIVVLPAGAQFRAAPGREYREFHNPVNPVKGEAVIGIALVPSEVEQREKSVRVFVPRPFSGEIRLETATANGRFRGEGTYAGSTNGNEWVSLELTSPTTPDGRPNPGRPIGATSLALSARGPAGELFISRWGNELPSGQHEKVRLYVNSRRGDMVVRAGPHVIPCRSNSVPQPVRFDAYCDIPLSDIPKDGRLTLIRREMFDEQSQAIRIGWR